MKVLDLINETNIIKAIRIITLFTKNSINKAYLFYFPLFNVPKCVVLDIVTILNNLPESVEHIESPDDMATTIKQYAPLGDIDKCDIHLLINDEWTSSTNLLAEELKQELRQED